MSLKLSVVHDSAARTSRKYLTHFLNVNTEYVFTVYMVWRLRYLMTLILFASVVFDLSASLSFFF